MPAHVTLAIAALLWFGIHKWIAGSGLRAALIRRLGEGGYRGFFSLLSALSLVFLIHAYRKAPCEPLWLTPKFLFWLPLLLVPIAFVFVVGAFTVPNPTAVMGEKLLTREEPARGMLRVTRHPMLWGVILWSSAHLVVNGNVPALLLFGSLLVTAIAGTRDIDRKREQSGGEAWQRFAQVTSSLPFAAILGGRNRLVWRELALPLVLGLLVAGAFMHFHTSLFGLSALRALG